MSRIGGVNLPTRVLMDRTRMWDLKNTIEDRTNRKVAEQKPHQTVTTQPVNPPMPAIPSPPAPYSNWKKT